MKKIIFVAAVALALCSCAKTELTGVDAGEMIIGASMEAYSSGTKAALADAGSFTWQTGDAIEVATSGGHANFSLKTGAGTASATFSAIYSGTLGNYAVYPADIFVSNAKVLIPASRNWSEGNTNCSMFGSLTNGNVAFKHLGGVVKVTLNGVPAEANKFVFSTPGKKITGEFELKGDADKYIETSDDNANSSYTLSFTLNKAENMAFYIPVPCGTYPKFALKVLGADDVVLNEFEGSSQQVVNRKDILIMPTLTIGTITGGGDNAEQGAISKTVPAGTKGNYRLPAAEKVILNFEGVEEPGDDVINLVYDGDSHLPSQLWLRVASGKKVNVSGDLQHTTVKFDQGVIYNANFKTAQNTFKIIAPARIEEKLTVKGGNVEISGEITGSDNVKAIEVVADATADGTSAPVQITLANKATVGTPEQGGENGGITTSANVVIVNNTDKPVNVTVPTEVQETVQVASAGTGEGVVKKNDEEVTTKPAAAIGNQNFFTLSDAVTAAQAGSTIEILNDIALDSPITISKSDITIDGKEKIIAVSDVEYWDQYKIGGDKAGLGKVNMISVNADNFTLKNVTLNGKDCRGVSLCTTTGGKNVLYQNVTYTGRGSGHYYGEATGLVTFDGCKFNIHGYAIHFGGESSLDDDVVIKNCEVNGWSSFGACKSLTISDSHFGGANDEGKNGWLAVLRPYCPTTITNCTFSNIYLHTVETDYECIGLGTGTATTVILNGCKVVDDSKQVKADVDIYSIVRDNGFDNDAAQNGSVFAFDAEGNATDGFKSGTFYAVTPANIKLQSGYAYHQIEGKSNIYGIHEIDAVATIGSVKYETLAAALDAASENDVVMLCKDIIRNVESNNSDRETYFVSGKKITLDLNGHIIKHRYGQNKYGVFEVKNSTFTIDDSSVEKNGKIADTYAQAVLYVENSTVNLKNGLLAAEYSSTSSTNYRVVKLKNSTFTMDGGSVLAATTGNYNRAFEFVHSTGTNSKVIVNNGVIKTHTSYAVVFYGDSNGYQGENNMVEINGGEISTEGNYGWLGDDLFGEIVMNGGSFTSNWHQVVDTNTKFTHNGGTVNIKSN